MNTLKLIMAVASGGALGGLLRHLLDLLLQGRLGLPEHFGTMAVNVLGCFLMGICVPFISSLARLPDGVRREERDPTGPVIDVLRPDPIARIWSGFLVTGLLGGMTTFSVYSLANLELLERGDHVGMFCNLFGTVLLGLIATWLGMLLAPRLPSRHGENAPH